MGLDVGPVWRVWEWLATAPSDANVRKLLVLLGLVLLIGISAIVLVRWLLARHLDDVAERLSRDFPVFRAKGVTQASLALIARCLAWVFLLKLWAELLEPFVILAFDDFGQRYWRVTLYDWLVLILVLALLAKYWLLFLESVKAHDLSRPESRIDRNIHRAHLLFWKPALVMLVVTFLPDLGKRATSIAADAVKSSELTLPFASPNKRAD